MWYKKKIHKQYYEKKPATEKCQNKIIYMLSMQENNSIYPRQLYFGCIV